ncbi:LysM peptidoglycan-binding domain-containing protein, partial [Fulvivirga sp. RKSG066]|uniref:lytic transglycosylase domain-containing protein n=1 Tax=Fulvivirga aurantia TaxID=2529383 RepID=UPI0012BBC29C
MKNIFLVFLLIQLAQNAFASTFSDTLKTDSTTYYFVESDYEYIPGDANFDLIADRLSCLNSEIPLNYNTRVHAFVNYFAVKDREYTKMIIKRKNVFFPLFEKYLKKYDLPDELKYLSIIESGLNPSAVSSARAVGLWQFMPSTGRYFGLHQDWYIDERMDPEQSTEAACRYLKQLYNMFGDWELAISAYNTGPGNIRRAIRRSGYKKSFWDIYPYLYRETRSYLPQFVAMIYVLNYAEEHNFQQEDLEFSMDVDTLHIKNYLHLETFANQLNLCIDDLKKLNPGLKRGVIPETSKGMPLRVPTDIKELLTDTRVTILDSASKVGRTELQQLATNGIGSTYGREKFTHIVRSGDVLGTIAERYKVRISDIRHWNNLSGNTIRIGQRLSIWQKPGYQPAHVQMSPKIMTSADGSKMYTVQPGDTLWDISRKFEGLSIEKLKTLNKLES